MIDNEGFYLYVEHNFDKVFDHYIKENDHSKCHYCTYTSTNRMLMGIQMENHEHFENIHKEVIDEYATNPDSYIFKDEDHEDFIIFLLICEFVEYCNLWIMGSLSSCLY